MIVKTVKVSDKGQISIPVNMRDFAGINTGDELIVIQEGTKILIEKPDNIIREDFKDLLIHSEKVARKFWSNKEDEVWNNL